MIPAIAACLLFAQAQPAPSSGLRGIDHKFVFKADKKFDAVSVAGTFNNWNNRANPLALSSDGFTWTGTVNLKPGKYQYKFVTNFTDWIQDFSVSEKIDDGTGQGNFNSVISVFPKDYAVPASPNDGKVTLSGLSHDTSVSGRNLDLGKLSISLTIRPQDAKSVMLQVQGQSDRAMKMVRSDGVVETLKASLPWDGKKPLRYSFKIIDGGRSFQFGPNGLTGQNSSNVYKLDKSFKAFVVPSWVERTVFYQIFPDRFANGKASNDPKDLQKWDAKPTYSNRFGGDIEGIKNRLGYLKNLGINGVYINPMMDAPANHRYDPVDFYKIDPELGSNKEFVFLTKEMRKQGIRMVLDQIFDHVGTTFSPFADLLQFQQNSRYKDWFIVKSWPVSVKPNPPYEAWYGFESMPKLNMDNPAVRDYLLDSVDFWMEKATLDGWRLDVANEVPDSFWRVFRQRVKSNDPNAWIVGEVWTDANQWLKGDQWDASMNYPFRFALKDHFAEDKTTPSQYMTALMGVYNLYPSQISRNQLNLLCSHDTARFLTEAGNRKKRQMLAAAVQFTWPGAPSVYYGEELGMEGGADPDNRRGMRWDLAKKENEMLKHYRWLTALRTRSEVLAIGEPQIATCNDEAGIASFVRVSQNDLALTVTNKGSKNFDGMIQLPTKFAGMQMLDASSGKTISINSQSQVRIKVNSETAWIGLLNTKTNRNLIQIALNKRNNQI